MNLTNKTLTRRTVLQVSAGAAALSASIGTASALDYPTRSVKIVVPVPPGGALDIHARLIGKYLAEHMGQSFIIENKPGAATNLGVEYVVRAPADGYTLLLMPSSVSVNETLYTNLSFHIPRDIIPVAMISSFPLAMEVNLSVPAKTVPEFIAYVKANPGKISIATSGNGSPQHMAGAFFMLKTGTQMIYVPYHGGAPAITDLMGGQIQVYFSPLPESMAVIKGRQGARTGCDQRKAFARIAGRADRRRDGAWLRGRHLAGHRGAERNARRDRRQAQ